MIHIELKLESSLPLQLRSFIISFEMKGIEKVQPREEFEIVLMQQTTGKWKREKVEMT